MFIKGAGGISSHLKLHTYKEGTILPVLCADELLFSSRHKGLVRKIKDLLILPEGAFETHFLPFIKRHIEMVQILPHKKDGIIGSLLNYGLARATAVLEKYMALKKDQTTPLLQFAILSAAMQKEMGRIICNQRVVCVDKDGKFIKDWNPLSGPLLGQTEYYKMYMNANHYLRIEKEVTLLLARQAMPRELFIWLSNDIKMFSNWIAALLGEEGHESNIISWALALVKRDDILAILASLEGTHINPLEATATEYGEAFYEWLKEALENDELAIDSDEASIHQVEEGIFLEKKLFKQFVDLSNVPVNFMVVFTQFGNLMGITEKGGNDFMHAQYFSGSDQVSRSSTFGTSTHKLRNGMVLSDPSMIFMNSQVPATTSLLKAMQAKIPESQNVPKTTTPNVQHTNQQK